MNEYLPYEQQEDIQGLIPRAQPAQKQLPDIQINDQAFYASSMYSNNPVEDYYTSKEELSSDGESPLVNNATEQWKMEQQFQNNQALASIVSDPSLPIEQKKASVLSQAMNGYISYNLRDRYKQKLEAENVDTTEADIEHRNQWLDTLHNVRLNQDQATLEVDNAKLNMARSFNYSTLDFMGGIAADFVTGRYGAHAALSEWNTINKDLSTPQRGWEAIKSFIFPGEANDKMNKWYNGLPDEDKTAFIKDLGDSLANTPGFDYNRWNTFRDVLDSPDGMPAAFKHIENVAGILDVLALKGFLGAGFTSGFLKAGRNVIRNWTTVDLPNPKPRPMPTDRVDPNPPTGSKTKEEETPRVFRSGRTGSPLSDDDYVNLQRTRIDPLSPAGTLEAANTKKAQQTFTQALVDDSGELAKSMGTDRGTIVSEGLLPKLTADVLDHADLANHVRKMDDYFLGTYRDTEFDPFFVPVTQREKDKEKLFNTLKEAQGSTYQQANSTMSEKIDSIEGVAVYGRNDSYGYSSAEDATEALNSMSKQLTKEDADALYIAHKNGQWYVNRPYKLDYDPYEQFTFGPDAVSAHFLGMDASAAARSTMSKWIWHPTQRLPEWVVKGAARQHMITGKLNADFMQYIQKSIKEVPEKTKPFLSDALKRVQENQVWESYKDFSTRMFAGNHKQEDISKAWEGYQTYKRMTDYQFLFANRRARRDMEADEYRGIYDKQGMHIGNGSEKLAKSSVKEVYDLDTGTVIRMPEDLQGRKLVKLEEHYRVNGGIYDHAILGSKSKLGPLPENVITKMEGYVPRQNIENFYVIKTPKSVRVNGEFADAKTIKDKYTSTIGAGATRQEAEALMNKLQKEFPDHTLDIKAERADVNDTVLTDYKVYKEVMEHSKKRGDRLPTMDGFARLEDPLEALWKNIQSSVRLDVWKDYDAVFRKNWLRQYGEFTKGEFPSVLTDIKAHGTMTAEDLKQWQSAQRLFEQYTNQRYKVTIGDELWKSGFHMLADSIENVVPKYVSQALRDTAGRGNALVRVPKTMANHLFLYLNPPRQWVTQTQQLLEWSLLDKDYLKIAPTVIPAMQMALLSRASSAAKHSDAIYATAVKLSGMNRKEFDATFKAIYDSGIPASVDLNMMLHGTFNEAKQIMDPSAWEKFSTLATGLAQYPGQVGKNVGYTPAELANTVGAWLFTRERWKKQNPGQNWNTPENIAKISSDAWEIGKAMSTRAGSMPYQDGAASLLFQFAAVQHKAFMEIFSSKTFTAAERAKLAAVRSLLWGAKGTALGGFVNWLIEEETDVMTQAEWHDFKGGLVDYVANSMVDMWLRKPGEKESDLSISASMSPMPEYLPYADFIINAKKLFDNDPTMPRFAFTGAVGNLMKASEEVSNIYKTQPRGSGDAFSQSMIELAKASSGYNNFAKALMLKEMDDKLDRFGNQMGLSTTRAQVVAQMFGIISKEEEHLYKINESMRERKAFIEQRAKEINSALINFKGRYDSVDYKDWVKVQQVLNTFTPEALRMEVEQAVDKLQLIDWGSRKESAYTDLYNFSKQNADSFVKKGLGHLESSNNPKDKETSKRIRDSLNIQ